MRFLRFSTRNGVSRTGASVILALWCLLLLAGGATKALCLDIDGECTPSASATAAPCHDQAPDSGMDSSCDSCVDIPVPKDAAVVSSRPDSTLRPLAAAQSLVPANAALDAMKDAVAATATPSSGRSPLNTVLRSTVLRI